MATNKKYCFKTLNNSKVVNYTLEKHNETTKQKQNKKKEQYFMTRSL